MILLSKKLVIDNTEDILKFKESKEKKVKLIIRDGKILIHIARIKKNESLNRKIDNIIKDLFLGHNPLVHYEKIWVRGKCFLLIYVMGCSNEFKKFLEDKKKFSIIPTDFMYKGGFSFNRLKIVLRIENEEFKIRFYLKRKLISVKTTTEENYLKDIKKELVNIEEIFNIKIKKFDFESEDKYISEELKREFYNCKLIKSRGDGNIYSKV
ncbi:hypothetical protein [Clostridium sp.]|uniref:hypothetical protein n=1 Tax=Clostridium sp. TaxID=1506 RepID=UPI00260C4B27|nr:hypothetical protein [Clostridium sp.]